MTKAPALWTRHRSWAIGISRSYYAHGSEAQDLEQEALIALWEAARLYDPAKGPFKGFASLVIKRRMIEVVRRANKIKNQIVFRAERDFDLEAPATDRSAVHELDLIIERYKLLSPLERVALSRSLNGDPIVNKSHDNALQRARRKLRVAA